MVFEEASYIPLVVEIALRGKKKVIKTWKKILRENTNEVKKLEMKIHAIRKKYPEIAYKMLEVEEANLEYYKERKEYAKDILKKIPNVSFKKLKEVV